MTGLLAELRRRNVFRVAAAYLVVGWLILQVIAVIAEPLGLPDWTDTLVIVLLGIAFPVALILAWAFEVTPEGVKLTASVPEGESISGKTGRRLDLIIVVGLAVLIGLIIWQQVTRDAPAGIQPDAAIAEAAGPADNTIAVLPFADLSAQGDQAYFADGIAEEILNVLAQIDALSVTSRTSAFVFRSDSNLSIPDIADALQVRHVLEGSVRTSGGMIRITAQLIDAETDQHLWSDTFDRELNAENVFAVQDEIAAAITRELATRLDVPIAAPTAARTTSDVDAYSAYLRGRELFFDRNYENLPRSIEALERAIALDPDFVEARAILSMAYAVSPGWGFHDRDYRQLSLEMAGSVLESQPDNPLALTTIGQAARILVPPDWDTAVDYYSRAIASDPRSPTARLWRAQAYRDLGFFELADQDLRACIEAEPLYGVCLYNHAANLLNLGRDEEALAALIPVMGTSHFESYPEFLGITAQRGDRTLLAYMLRELADSIGDRTRWIVPGLLRALSDEDFDRDAALDQIRRRLLDDGHEPDDYTMSTLALAHGLYERVPEERQPAGWIWFRGYPGLPGSDAVETAIRRERIDAYWREHGFPPQCEPVGDDGFECGWIDSEIEHRRD